MTIDKDTKISIILKEKPEAIDVIASINRNFKKLQNPFLRKMLAPRVSVDAAARVGNSTVNKMLAALEQIGFDVKYEPHISVGDEANKKEIEKTNINMTNIINLDVRPILETGVDPFNVIMDTLKTVKDDETLRIINTFEPIPLLNILKGKGYEYETERPEDGIVHTFLRRVSDAKIEEAETPIITDENLSYEEWSKNMQEN